MADQGAFFLFLFLLSLLILNPKKLVHTCRRMHVTTGMWNAAACVGKLVFFDPAHDNFRITLTVTSAGAAALRRGQQLQIGTAGAPPEFRVGEASGSIESSYAGTGATVSRTPSGVSVRIDATENLAFWVGCTIPDSP
jgi:hypothetical protein